jgi:hypothetical protein
VWLDGCAPSRVSFFDSRPASQGRIPMRCQERQLRARKRLTQLKLKTTDQRAMTNLTAAGPAQHLTRLLTLKRTTTKSSTMTTAARTAPAPGSSWLGDHRMHGKAEQETDPRTTKTRASFICSSLAAAFCAAIERSHLVLARRRFGRRGWKGRKEGERSSPAVHQGFHRDYSEIPLALL